MKEENKYEFIYTNINGIVSFEETNPANPANPSNPWL